MSSDPYRDSGRPDSWPPRSDDPGGPPPRGPGRTGQPYKGGKPKPKWRRIALFAGIAVLIIAVIAGIWFFSGMSNSESAKDNAIANAADNVGAAAQQAGNAVEDAADNVSKDN